MAVIEVSEPIEFNREFIGLSIDAKPTDVKAGSRFFESNTGLWFVNINGTNWVQEAVA
jgi:hypothetical protein